MSRKTMGIGLDMSENRACTLSHGPYIASGLHFRVGWRGVLYT